VCDTKRNLLGEYDATAKRFSKAVGDVTKLRHHALGQNTWNSRTRRSSGVWPREQRV